VPFTQTAQSHAFPAMFWLKIAPNRRPLQFAGEVVGTTPEITHGPERVGDIRTSFGNPTKLQGKFGFGKCTQASARSWTNQALECLRSILTDCGVIDRCGDDAERRVGADGAREELDAENMVTL
jgi:hypothetical protein